MADPLDRLDDDLALHREFVADRSPVYARTLDLLRPAVEGGFAERLREAWAEREFGPWFERPLLLLTALRDDALREGAEHPLWAPLAGSDPDPGAVTESRLEASVTPDRDHFWGSVASRFVQTNETSRAVAWLWPAALAGEAEPGRELEIFDFGASAGLNLVADRMPWVWNRADGAALAPSQVPPIRARRGFDLRPLDLRDPEDERWLRALLWPGQTDRMERLEAGIGAFRVLAGDSDRPLVEAASVDDAAGTLDRYREEGPRGIAYQSIMHDYLPDDVRERYEGALRDWLWESDPRAALWIEFEIAEGGRDGETAVAIIVHLSTGDDLESVTLARAGPHPRVIEVDDSAVERFRVLIAG